MVSSIVRWNGKLVGVADSDSKYYLGQVMKKDMDNPDKRFGPVIVPIDECEVVTMGGSL